MSSQGETGRARAAILTGAAAAIVALAITLPGLFEHGLWAESETMVHARAQAALGAAKSGLVRAPWLPDALRTWALAAFERPEAIRVPGAIASSLLVGLCAMVARRRGLGAAGAAVAAAFALAFPLTQGQGRLALGDPVGELLATLAALLGASALRRPPAPALAMAAGAALCLGLAVASAGLVLGGLLPLVAVALALPQRGEGRRATLSRGLVWLAIGALALVAFVLASGQGDGYIPLLGAARDPVLVERPYARGLAASLEEFGHQLYPWLPLALVGVLRPGSMAWPAMWLCAGLAIHGTWSMVYGPGAIPLTLPAALCCAAGLAHLADPATSRPLRRLGLVLAAGGVLVLAKDARRTPGAIAAALAPPASERSLDAATIGAERLLPRLGDLAIVLLAAAAVAGNHRRPRAWLGPAVALLVLGHQSLRIGHRLVPAISEQISLRRPFVRLAAWTEAGALPTGLAVGRLRDPTLEIYGPPAAARQVVGTRAEIAAWLARPEPSAALIRQGELAGIFADARQGGWPLHVLDHGHRDAVLVANTLPAGTADEDPLLAIVGDGPPELAHQTRVRFEDYLEVVGWELDGPLLRGGAGTLVLGLRVLRPLPAGAQLNARLQGGRLSRIGGQPRPFADGLYPPNLWRAGDYITHRQRIEVPLLEVISGGHDLIVGVRVSPSKNLEISEPQGERGDYGVEIRDKQRSFARVGSVQVW